MALSAILNIHSQRVQFHGSWVTMFNQMHIGLLHTTLTQSEIS